MIVELEQYGLDVQVGCIRLKNPSIIRVPFCVHIHGVEVSRPRNLDIPRCKSALDLVLDFLFDLLHALLTETFVTLAWLSSHGHGPILAVQVRQTFVNSK